MSRLTPEDLAQELIDQAWEEDDDIARVRLVLQALARSPDHADGYVLLAQQVGADLVAMRELYEQGVVAGERALGTSVFAEEAGSFWGLIQTRPYMRARHGLALTLWKLGEKQQAIGHLEAMLKLNPHDNQGVRYSLIAWLFEVGPDAELSKLFDAYQDDATAEWGYTRALWTFRNHGDGRKATRLLRDALRWNPHVPAYLLGSRQLPKQVPPYVSLGEDSEAIAYAAHASHLWQDTEGALAWLTAQLARKPASSTRRSRLRPI
jgi:tetratricopeptide (TPR) repeat protein